MTPNIVQIDKGKVDNEILDLKSLINRLTNELDEANMKLEIRQGMIKYIDAIAIGEGTKKPGTDNTARIMGVSEFIMDFLKDGEKDTKAIITAYATHTKSTYAKVSGNVSNALSRLKTVSNKINNRLKDGGRKAGSAWFITK